MNHKKNSILFTGVGRRIELIEQFRLASLVTGYGLKIYGTDIDNTAPALMYCDEQRIICNMTDPNYIDELLNICKMEKIDLVIPTIDTDLMILAENKDRFTAIGTKVLISSIDKINICRDKNNTYKFFIQCGLTSPNTINNWEMYDDIYPAFIKPKDGSSSINAFKVRDERELKLYASQIENYIIQPFISGVEYTVDAFCDFEGNPITITPRIRLAVRGGEVLKTQIVMDDQIILEVKKLLDIFKPCGPITIQLIKNLETGINYYIEINPRFGGGAPLSMKAGARTAEILLNLLNDKKYSYKKLARDGEIYSRFDQSICISNISTDYSRIRGIIFDLDDTLYSEKEYIKSGYQEISKYLGNDEYFSLLWHYFNSGKLAIDELLRLLNRESDKQKILNIYRTHKPDIKLYKGVEHLLSLLKENGMKIGIITDGRVIGQKNKIKALNLEYFTNDIIITDELGGEQFRKPCDIPFRIMATKWKLNPEEIIYIGDNIGKDFQACKKLGMNFLWFKNSDGLYIDTYKECTNLSFIESIMDVLDVLKIN